MKLPFKYNLRNLRVRWMTSALTAGGTALTVAVFVGIMALSKGLELTMQTSGDAQNLIVMRQGATVELNSQVTQEQYQTLRDLEGVAKDGREPLVSPEMVVAINRPRRGSTSTVSSAPATTGSCFRTGRCRPRQLCKAHRVLRDLRVHRVSQASLV